MAKIRHLSLLQVLRWLPFYGGGSVVVDSVFSVPFIACGGSVFSLLWVGQEFVIVALL